MKGLEKLTNLTWLAIFNNPNLTKAQIGQLQKVLPKCEISHNAKKQSLLTLTNPHALQVRVLQRLRLNGVTA